MAGVVVEKLRAVRPLTGHELPFLKQHSPGAIKMTLPSATQFPAISYKRGRSDKAYPTYSALLWDIVAIMKVEMARLAAEGVKYIQIDAPRYSYFMDPKWREWISTEMKVEPEAWFEESIRADNACFEAARRPGVTLAIHLCRGNSQSHWYAEGGYDAVAEKLFGTLDVDRFLLEYDDSRSGTFEPLRFIPRNKIAVLGLISSKRPELEDGDQLVARIKEAAQVSAARKPHAEPAVRFRFGDAGESDHRRPAVGQAEARGRYGPAGLELIVFRLRQENGGKNHG